MAPPHTPLLTVSHKVLDGQHMVATTRGSGPDCAILLHGLPGCRHDWNKVADALGSQERLIIPDLLGFGDSSPLRAHQHAEAEAHAVLELADRLGVGVFDLAGHDFGGPTALWITRLAPERVRSLALMATNAFRDTPIPGALKTARVPVLGEVVFRMMLSRFGLSMMWRQATADRVSYPYREFEETIRSATGRRSTREVFLDSLRHIEARYGAVEATLATVLAPSVVIWGAHDPFFPLPQGRRLATALRTPHFAALAGCGHFVPRERPLEVAKILRDHWSEARRGVAREVI